MLLLDGCRLAVIIGVAVETAEIDLLHHTAQGEQY